MGVVFQSYALFPNMTAAENIAYGLDVRKRSKADVKRRVAELVELIQIGDAANRYPHQLSGGQQQRVALARALAIEPPVLLLDEPLSALDAAVRLTLRLEIRRIQRSLGIATMYITHDQEEALSISDRVAVMREGRVEQLGTPEAIYTKPANAYVAGFVGTSNRLPVEVTGADGAQVEWQGRVRPGRTRRRVPCGVRGDPRRAAGAHPGEPRGRRRGRRAAGPAGSPSGRSSARSRGSPSGSVTRSYSRTSRARRRPRSGSTSTIPVTLNFEPGSGRLIPVSAVPLPDDLAMA